VYLLSFPMLKKWIKQTSCLGPRSERTMFSIEIETFLTKPANNENRKWKEQGNWRKTKAPFQQIYVSKLSSLNSQIYVSGTRRIKALNPSLFFLLFSKFFQICVSRSAFKFAFSDLRFHKFAFSDLHQIWVFIKFFILIFII
jgi:hypothetical protein